MKSAMLRNLKYSTVALIAGLCLCGVSRAETPVAAKTYGFSPPWQHGANNDIDVSQRGLDFTEPDADNLADFHGSPVDPKLSLFVGGNYFFAMAQLVQKFEELHPEFKGRIYWETIPPGLLVKQIQAGGTITVGNMT